jgi:multicomponent Na+:H+ antiporter subunit E
MTRRAAQAAWLLFVWLALTGRVSMMSALVGLAISAALLAFFRPARDAGGPAGTFRPWYALRFLAFFARRFLAANIEVALAVIRPERVRVARAVIAVPIVAASEATTILLANAMSLTPGTFMLDMQDDPPTMYVHLLQLRGVQAARLDVLEMERRILLAFGPAGAPDRVKDLMARIAADAA